MAHPHLIVNDRTDPCWNLAAEEVLLNTSTDDIFMLWRNGPSVIVGRNQNTLSEIDHAFVSAHNIPVVRRLTGGGAVFHDLGNVNFTHMAAGSGTIDFARFTSPVVAALRQWGLPASLSGRNDILIDGLKVSGNAQTIKNNRVLHHGTLLYNADLSTLSDALRTRPDKYKGRSVASVASRVGNIAAFVDNPPPVEDFLQYLRRFLTEQLQAVLRAFTPEETEAIDTLRREKYATDEWNFGRMAHYAFHGHCRTEAGGLDIFLEIEGGRITAAQLSGDFFGRRDAQELADQLTGLPHTVPEMTDFLSSLPLEEYLWGFKQADVMRALF